QPIARLKRQGVPLPTEASWPRLAELPVEPVAATLPAPAPNVFEMPDERAAFRSSPPRRPVAEGQMEGNGKSNAKNARGVRTRAADHPGRATRVAHRARSAPNATARHSSGAKKKLRVASLKKR